MTSRPSRPVSSLEGRAAPGLYLAGWLLSGLGLATVVVAFLSAGRMGVVGLVLLLGGFLALALGLVAAAGAQGLQRRADGLTAYPGPSPFLVFGAAFVVVNLAYAPLFLAGEASHLLDPTSPAGVLVSILLSALIYIALIRLLVVGPGGLRWGDMGVHRPDATTARDVGLGVATALPVYVGTLLLAVVLAGLVRTVPESPIPMATDPGGILLDLVAAALLAPLGEELFFRGFATTAWWRTMGAERAVVRGALFFALVHVISVGGATFDEGVARAVIAFATRLPVALALGQLYIRRRSLYATVSLHATFNTLGVLLALLASRSAG